MTSRFCGGGVELLSRIRSFGTSTSFRKGGIPRRVVCGLRALCDGSKYEKCRFLVRCSICRPIINVCCKYGKLVLSRGSGSKVTVFGRR